jgi:hypothetical protein
MFLQIYIDTKKPIKVLFALTELLMNDEVTRILGIVLIAVLGNPIRTELDLVILRLAVLAKEIKDTFRKLLMKVYIKQKIKNIYICSSINGMSMVKT